MFKISGKVVHGDGYGRKIGFPTLNLNIETKDLPAEGVYAGTANLGDKEYNAGIIIGPSNRVEAHLIGYYGDAYGKEATIQIKNFIREFKKFDTEEELIKQINKDIQVCML